MVSPVSISLEKYASLYAGEYVFTSKPEIDTDIFVNSSGIDSEHELDALHANLFTAT